MLVDDRPSHPVAEPALSHEDSGQLGLRPSFAEKLNRRIDSELRMLSKHNENVAASDRLAVFRDVAHQLVPCFQYFGPLLARILGEYDAYVDHVRGLSKRCRELEAASETTFKDLRAELASATQQRDQLLAADAERRARVEAVLERDAPHILAERVGDLQRKLAAERAARGELEHRLSKSSELSQQFQEALRTMQANYERILVEKDEAAHELQEELNRAKSLAESQKERDKSVLTHLEDVAAAGDIEIAALKTKITLLQERVRNLEGRVAGATARYAELQESYGVLEDRLERLNKPTSSIVSRDPVMTPRPSKAELVNRVPTLGTPTNFHSTQSIIDALLQAYDVVLERAKKAEDMSHASKQLIAQRTAQYRQLMADRARGIETTDTATQMEVP